MADESGIGFNLHEYDVYLRMGPPDNLIGLAKIQGVLVHEIGTDNSGTPTDPSPTMHQHMSALTAPVNEVKTLGEILHNIKIFLIFQWQVQIILYCGSVVF